MRKRESVHHQGGRPKRETPRGYARGLRSQGITRRGSSRAQRIAAIPAEDSEAHIAKAKQSDYWNPDYKDRTEELFKKPLSEWTPKQKEWLRMVSKRLFPSPRGRKPKKVYDYLFQVREVARFKTPDKVPSYTKLASRAAGREVSPKPEDEDPARQQFIRAYQRRKKALRLPDPPEK